jgi:DNA-binding transcriptional LysR family regulator
VREGLAVLERFPGRDGGAGKRKLRVAVTPTFARSMLMPRLRGFTEAYPEVDLTLQVSIPLLDVVAEDADLMIRFGTGRYADVEHLCLMTDEVTPLASPAYLREHGPFDTVEDCCSQVDQESAGALAHLVPGARRGRAGAGRRFVLQRHRPDVRRRRAGPGRRAGAAEAGQPWLENGTLERVSSATCRARMRTTCAGAPARWTAGSARPSRTG